MGLGYTAHFYPSITRSNLNNSGVRGTFREKEVALQLRFDIAVWGCDVIHAHTTYPSGYIAAKVTNRSKIPLVVTPHGYDIDTIPELGFGMRLDPILRQKIDQTLVQANAVTAISAGIESSIIKAGTDPKKIFRIPNGVDIQRYENKSSVDIHKRLNLTDNSKLLVTVGNYHPRKGHEVIINAMPGILEEVAEARLVIVGKNTHALTPLIEKLGLQDKVVLTGTIPFPLSSVASSSNVGESAEPDLLAAIYGNSEIYVSAGTSQSAEGLSLAVLEAMAAGLPIIGSRITGNSDIIEHGENGFLVEPTNVQELGERIIQLLKDNLLRTAMAEKAKAVAYEYEWLEIARRYVDLYEKMLPDPVH